MPMPLKFLVEKWDMNRLQGGDTELAYVYVISCSFYDINFGKVERFVTYLSKQNPNTK